MYNLNKKEKSILEEFKNSKIPEIFKDDYIEHMLFIELLDFDICSSLINNEDITISRYNEAIEGYNCFVEDIDIKKLDRDALKYYGMCKEIMLILKEKKINNLNLKG